MKGSDNA
ncbi:unnamed protein product [Staurois parvus]|nr:unnamed protein product [Staurois parvus]